MQVQIKRIFAATGFAGVMGLVGVVGVAGGPSGTTMRAVPSEGLEPGDSFEVTNADGSECFGEVTGDAGGIRPGQWVADVEENGDWSVTIEIPENGPPDPMGEPTPFPPGEYEIHAFCNPPQVNGPFAPAQQQPREYDPITVTIVAPQQEPAPTTEAPTTTAPSTTTTAPPVAAAPTVAAPTYTG